LSSLRALGGRDSGEPAAVQARAPARTLALRGWPVAAAGFGALMGIGVGTAVWVMVVGYSPVPFADRWGELPFLERAVAGHLHIGDFWAQANEHRIVVPRIQFVLEYALFGGRYVFLFSIVALSCVLIACVVAAVVWLETKDRLLSWAAFCVAAMATLSPAAEENLTWGLPGLVQVYLFASIAALAVAVAAQPGRRDSVWTAVAAASALAASYSVANGLLLWPLLLVVALALRLRLRLVAALAAAGALTWFSYIWHFEPVARHASYRSSLEHPLSVAKYVAVYLGGPLHDAGGLKAAGLAGAVGLILLAVLTVVAWRERAARPIATIWGAAVALFVLLSAAETAVGRLNFGLTQATSSRYETACAVFWLALVVGLLRPAGARVRFSIDVGGRSRSVGFLAVLALTAVMALAVDLMTLPSGTSLRQTAFDRELAVVGFRSGVDDPGSVTGTPPGTPAVARGLAWLRSERLGPWAPSGMVDGSRISLRRPLRNAPSCRGQVDAADAVPGGTRLRGWIVAPDGVAASHQLAVLAVGRLVTEPVLGLGLVGASRPDVKAAGAARSSWTGFVAYARGEPSESVRIVLVAKDHRGTACTLDTAPA